MDQDEEAAEAPCANPGCPVGRDGRCLEGFTDLARCPQYGKSLVFVATPPPPPVEKQVQGIPLPLANQLTLSAAEQVLRAAACHVIALVGPHDAGKTSLIAGMYDQLQRGPLGGHAFAGSLTLHAFERACHDSRRESEREVPHMERTERGQVEFFHMELVNPTEQRHRTALFGNRAGEEYGGAIGDAGLVRRFPELKRSDTLTILADGAKISDAGERHEVRSSIRMSIRSFLEAKVLGRHQRLAIVLTKLDAVRAQEDEGVVALRTFDALVRSIRTDHAADFLEIEAFAVAASPKVASVQRGEGMAALLTFWMADPGRFVHPVGATPTTLPRRAFGKLTSQGGTVL